MSGTAKSLQPIAWRLQHDLPDSLRYVRVLSLPEPIYATLRDLRADGDYLPPIASLHDALATFSHSIIAFDPTVFWDDAIHRQWLYATNDTQIDVERLQRLIKTWLVICYGREASQATSHWRGLHWSWDQLDLQTATEKQKRMLLPGLVARWLLDQKAQINLDSSNGSVPMILRLAPLMTRRYVAELISEPHSEGASSYSLVLRFWLETIPGTNELSLLHKPSLRRWISYPMLSEKGFLNMKPGRGKGVYLRRSTGYLDHASRQDVFTRITLKCIGYGENGICWMGRQPQVYTALSVDGAPPEAVTLARTPAEFQSIALVTMENRESQWDDVGTGLESGDHRHLFEQINVCLQPVAVSSPRWKRVPQGDHNHKLGPRSYSQQKQQQVPAEVRLQALKMLGYPARIVLHTDDVVTVKREILKAIGVWESYQDRIAENPLCIIGEDWPLLEIAHGDDPQIADLLPDYKAKGETKWKTEQVQRTRIAKRHDGALAHTGALIALPDYRRTMKSRDPKEVIRGGLIDARQASQFFTPRGEDKAKKYRMRVLNAVGDLLRTLGYRFNPYYVKPPDLPLPAEMDLIVFWLIQLNARRRNEQKVLLPVVGDAPAGATHLRVWIPTDSGNAELYPTLREGIVAANQYGDYFRQPAATISFFRDAMRKRQSNRPALLLLADQNLRRVFPELGDPQGDGDISLYEILDPKSPVRVARLRFSVDDEAPFCVPGDVKGKYQGLYGHADFPTVFYSLHNLGERHQSGNWRKLNSPEKAAANPSTVQIWMNNLQPDDEPAAWAGLVHRLRLESSHTDIPTRYPQPLHDLQIIPQYLSRLVDDQEEEDLNAVDETIEQG